jgi:protein-tyrosine phosphatase
MQMTRNLLFLCTANYYRSRFAELLFNHRAARRQLAWHADSRGLATELGADNVGPIFPAVLAALKPRGIEVGADSRYPLQVREDDFARADRVIALDATEHRPFLEERFPAWADRVEYWHVPDLHAAEISEAIGAIEHQVDRLVEELANHHG